MLTHSLSLSSFLRRGFNLLVLSTLLAAVPLAAAFAAAGDTEMASVSSAGVQGNAGSDYPSMSSDGRYVTFQSDASNLVAGDTNGFTDIFVRDLQTGTTVRVSVDSSGTQANNASQKPVISDNGRYIAFQSSATNLVAGDTNTEDDIFVHDLQTGTTVRVSVDSAGNQSNQGSENASITADGGVVVFSSPASNLVAGDGNGTADIFLHELSSGDTTRISVDSSGNESDNSSNNPFISSTGRYVVFDSYATNLVAGDTNAVADIFLRDLNNDTTVRVSVDSSGNQANAASAWARITADGNYVTYGSDASNLVAGDSNTSSDVFVLNRNTGVVERVSVSSSGDEGNNGSFGPLISADGRYVVFWAYATNLATPVAVNPQIYVHDRTTATTEMVSKNGSGAEADQYSGNPQISSDGGFVAYHSPASNLVAGDSNGVTDIFVYQLVENHQASSEGKAGTSVSADIASSGTTTLQLGDIVVSVPASAVAGLGSCRLGIEDLGSSGQFGFTLDDTVWDVDIVCDGVNQHIFFAPIRVCIQADGSPAGKQVFHRDDGGGAFTAMALVDGPAGYVCAETRVLSLFTLGSVSLPATGFAPGVAADLAPEVVYAATGLQLNIPELGLTTDIVGVPQDINGWDVSWLGNQAGFLQGTAFPTLAGNTVITAHVWGADNQPGPFYELESLAYGDRFTISAWGNTYTYEVRSNELHHPNALRPLGHEDYDWVTLVTCEGFDEAVGEYLFRRVVRAVLVSVD